MTGNMLCVRCLQILLFCGVGFGIELKEDLHKLSQILPGVYSNNPRTSKNLRHSFSHRLGTRVESPAEALTAMSMNAIYRPVNVTFLPECLNADDTSLPKCFNVYVQQTLYGKHKPHMQWLYSFAVDESSKLLRLRVYNLLDKSLGEKLNKNPSAAKYLSRNDVSTRSDCDMHWRRLGDTFVGTTSRRCVAEVNGRQVRISVMTTLTSASLQIDEGWYNVDDGSKLIELEGPIFMTKVETIVDTDTPYEEPSPAAHSGSVKKAGKMPLLPQQDGRVKRNKQNNGNAIPEVKRSKGLSEILRRGRPNRKHQYASNTVPVGLKSDHSNHNKYPTNEEKILNTAILRAGFKRTDTPEINSKTRHSGAHTSSNKKKNPRDKQKTTWNVQTYSGVIDALINGHKLYFTARTKRCHHDRVPVRERTMFGDYVEVFEIGKDSSIKQPYTHLTFSFKRLQHTKTGFHDVVKEITVHRNGSVHIATVYLNEEGEIDRHAFTVCTLFDQDNVKGDVKFYLDPYRDVAAVSKFGHLRSSLQKGKMIRMTTDLEKCSGGKLDHVILGGEFRSYDLGRNGKTIDVTLKRQKVIYSESNSISIEEQYMIFRFVKHGETTVLYHTKHLTSQSRNFSIVSGYIKYKCEIDQNSSTKAISLFNS